ncbi:uncharacterized protein LOC135212014 isoform X3 [Macrobrachium nipponense]|uniref:uncharacterized protein LOC135212014 isoform X3 n=1 Tax=Macrobrachium nipponense TaxID=159736 RepID=UPI0030C81A7C
MNILSIRKIDIANFNFVTEVQIILEWVDERLVFKHLNKDIELNAISNFIPWLPELEFLGDGMAMSEVQLRRSRLTVNRQSDPLPDNDQEVQEALVFEGKKNPLILKRKLTITTTCQFDLGAFPFDTQVCTMITRLSKVTKEYVKLEPLGRGVHFLGVRRGLEYQLESEVMIRKNDVSSSIPRTAYLKLVDVWFVYCVISLFAVCVVIVVIQYLHTEVGDINSKKSANNGLMRMNKFDQAVLNRLRAVKVNYICRIVYPVISAIFLIAYAVIGYKKSDRGKELYFANAFTGEESLGN